MMSTESDVGVKQSYDDDKAIDFRKLEKELSHAVEDEARYWRENDAKFRAVNQKVATYDEFRDIVRASHLKPLDKDDRLTDVKFVQPWNSQAAKKEESANKEKTDTIASSGLPTSGQSFIRAWRQLNKDIQKQYNYLLLIGGERLEQIFKPEIGFGLLGDFGHCLNCGYRNDDYDQVCAILEHLAKTNRFTLTVQFLSSKEKSNMKELFVKLKDSVGDGDSATLDELQKTYDVKL